MFATFISKFNCFVTSIYLFQISIIRQYSIFYSHIMISSYLSSCLCHCYENMFDNLFENAIFTNVQDLYELHATKSTFLRKCAWFLKIQKVVQSKSISNFACKRCFVKFSNNIKFHEHIRCHHAKKSKFVVSFNFYFFIFSHSIIFLFDISNFVITSKSQQTIVILSNISFFTFFHSIILSFFTSKRIFSFISSKRSSFSNFASKFVSKRSKNAFFYSFISFSSFAFMRSTFLFIKSIFVTFTKLYLIIIDLFNMFVEKFMKAKLFSNQNSSFFSNIFAFRQARIIFYFLFIFASKSTKFEIFTAMHVSMKQSIRATSSRSSFRFSSFSFSTRFSFSTTFYFFFVCWHCQTFLVIYLHNNECFRVVEKAEIFVKRRKRRLFRKVWTNC